MPADNVEVPALTINTLLLPGTLAIPRGKGNTFTSLPISKALLPDTLYPITRLMFSSSFTYTPKSPDTAEEKVDIPGDPKNSP